MKEPRLTPREVAPTADGARLRITWEDDAVHEYAPRALRLACPCAGCVDEMTGEALLRPGRVPEDVYPLEIQYVGRYALTFHWSDGHRTGIYPWDLLRRLGERGE